MKKSRDTAAADALGFYRILGVAVDASAAEVKQSYRDRAKLWHPDHNPGPQALENFQKLSLAYETLKDDSKRLDYDLLSLVCGAADFPELEIMEPLTNGSKESSLRVINPVSVRGYGVKYTEKSERHICSYAQAVRLEFKTALLNWLLGWWHPQAALKNIQALVHNFREVNPRTENLKLLIHNAVAYRRAQAEEKALQSALEALAYATPPQALYLKKFISAQKARTYTPRPWNFITLRVVQLALPAVLAVAALFPYSVSYVSDFDLTRWFGERNEIAYYQEVDFGTRGRSVDDVVVGKIINFPVDRSNISKLFHLKKNVVIMHGPSEDFDVLTEGQKGQTVRLTGISPDNVWARIMLDSGEMGFVPVEILQKGIGRPIPSFSKIYDGS